MTFSEQTLETSVNDAWNLFVRPVGSLTAARSRGLSLLKSLAAAPVTRDLLKMTATRRILFSVRVFRQLLCRRVHRGRMTQERPDSPEASYGGTSYGTPHGTTEVEISLYSILKEPLIS